MDKQLNTYKIDAFDKTKLYELGFKRNNTADESYTYKFPVMFYKKKPTLWCILTIFVEDRNVKINVVTQDDNFYAPFYVQDKVHESIVSQINKNIKQKLKTLGIKKQAR